MTKFYWFLGHEQFQPEDLVSHAKLVEAMGFDGVIVSEHLQPWVDDVGAGGFALSTLGAIAEATSKIKLMTGVVTPLFRYHPAIIAQAAATIDRLSKGRFELGIGSGENINEAPLGQVLPSYKERNGRLAEAIVIMRDLLDKKTVDFKGKYYQVDNLKLYSPPHSRVPIYLAASGPKSATLAATLCDGVITSVKNIQDTKKNVIDPISIAKTNDFRLIASRWSVYANNDSEAWKALQSWRGLRAPSRDSLTRPIDLQNEADQLPREVIMKQYNQLRSVRDILSCYGVLVKDLNADTVCFQITSTDQMKTIKLIGKEVLPILHNIKKG
jgi:coenzyme F420-dependent glucose-6-phosphate dehydrogenase